MKVLVDMDEVLVDFVGGALRVFGVSRKDWEARHLKGTWGMVPALGVSEEEFWARIGSEGEEFWTQLRPHTWAEDLLALVRSLTNDWAIVTAPTRSAASYSGKVKWLRSFLGLKFDRFVLTGYKTLMAGKGAVLIDDREASIDLFTQAGGTGVVFPTYNNRLHHLRDKPLEYVEGVLTDLAAMEKNVSDWSEAWRTIYDREMKRRE